MFIEKVILESWNIYQKWLQSETVYREIGSGIKIFIEKVAPKVKYLWRKWLQS